MAVLCDVGALDRHEVLDLRDTVGCEARDEDVRVGKYSCLDVQSVVRGCSA